MPDVIRGFIEDGVVKKYDYESLANKPESDSTLSVEGGFADAKKVGEEIARLEALIMGQTETT